LSRDSRGVSTPSRSMSPPAGCPLDDYSYEAPLPVPVQVAANVMAVPVPLSFLSDPCEWSHDIFRWAMKDLDYFESALFRNRDYLKLFDESRHGIALK